MHPHDKHSAQGLPLSGGDGRPSVPVFDCHVILTPPTVAKSRYLARASKLANIEAEGTTEREALLKVVAAFKAKLLKHHQQKTEIPWLDPPLEPQPGDLERWIPVHL